jgi:hypothetical protein
MHAICMLRNVLEDQIIYPDCHKKNINLDFAERALNYLRMTPDLPREQFATAWSSSAFGHVLINLWRVAAPTIEMFASDARRHAVEIGFEPPLASLELKPIIDLLGALDDGGDGFRYPSSLSGAWYVAVPSLSLEALKALVGRLQSTCTVFRWLENIAIRWQPLVSQRLSIPNSVWSKDESSGMRGNEQPQSSR